jgi:hypothetical protein
MEYNRSRQLVKKYLNGTATPEETAILEDWYNKTSQSNSEPNADLDYDRIGAEILNRLRTQQRSKPRLLWPRIAAVAAVLLIGVVIFFQTRSVKTGISPDILKDAVVPGRPGAVLTLANGTKIDLAKINKGKEVYQGETRIARTADSSLVYNSGRSNAPLNYNELSTSFGRTYAVVLADGTKVWLNAGSSLRFPTNFTGNERKVFLKGEAYFEVVYNKAKPFYVITGDQVTEDLGTSFDINAYGDEPYIETTLIEGSVKVTRGGAGNLLKPGQHALTKAGGQLLIEDANVDKIAAWRNGTFAFDGENIEVIMRQVARWYDVEVIYQTPTKDKDFVATISRYSNISEVLKKLQYTGVIHFKVEGRRVFVMP